MQCAEKLLETMKQLSCWTRHFRSWMTIKKNTKIKINRKFHYMTIHEGRLKIFQVMSTETHPSKTDFKRFLLSLFQLLLLQDSLLPSVLLLSWQKVLKKQLLLQAFMDSQSAQKVPASWCATSYSEINLFRSLSLFFSSACKRINRCDAWFTAAPVQPGLPGTEWEISHSLHPADLWPCCTSAAPASAAARHPPARPGAAAGHPNERERERGRERVWERDGCIKESVQALKW